MLALITEALLYYICLFFIMSYLLDYEIKRRFLIFIFPFLCLSSLIISEIFNIKSSAALFVLYHLCIIICIKSVFKELKLLKILEFYVLIYAAVLLLSSNLCLIFNANGNEEIIIGIISIVLVTAIVLVFSLIQKNKNNILIYNIPKSIKIVVFVSLFSADLLITLIMDYKNFTKIQEADITIRIVLVLALWFVGAAFPMLIANSVSKSFYLNQTKDFEKQIEVQAEYYAALSKYNFDLRRFKHDFKNASIGIRELLDKKDFEGALEILDSYDNALLDSMPALIKFDTGNNIVDALLSDKQNKALKSNTNIEFAGAVATDSILPLDLCIIFGNAVDNAIEACEKIESQEKVINISCYCRGGYMMLTIANPVEKDIAIVNNHIKTTKEDKANHGFGLFSINKIVRKYDGRMELECKNNVFTINIDLNLNALN